MLRTCLSGSNKRLIRQWLSHPIPSYLTVNAFTTPQSRQNLAFSSYRNQSSILQSTKEAIDLLNSTSESSSVRKFDTSGDKTEFDLKYPFQENFDMTQGNIDIYDVKEGGYISLNESDLKRYLPELKQTTLSSEFNLTQSKNMMIRDVNKVLCKLVDTYDKNRQVDGKQNVKSPQTAGYANNLPFFGLSNRPEWPTAKLNTYYYGKLLSIPTKHIEPPIVAIKGPESKQDKIVSMILDENEKKIPQKVLLSGSRGTGKSFALAHTVLHARKRGWIALYIPNGWDHVQSGSFVEPVDFALKTVEYDEDAEVSALSKPHEEMIYDNQLMSRVALRSFWKAHQNILSTLPIQHPQALDKYSAIVTAFGESWVRARSLRGRETLTFIETRAAIEQEDNFPDEDELDSPILEKYAFNPQNHLSRIKTLKDLVELGIAFPDAAGMIFIDLVEELKNLKDVPVLFAVDEYNTWEGKSVYQFEDYSILGKQICVPYALNFLSNKKAMNNSSFQFSNGICIASTSQHYSEGKKINYLTSKDSLPLLLEVPSYSQTEFLSVISYYVHMKIINPCFTSSELLGFRTFSQSNPKKIRDDFYSYFGPLAHEKDYFGAYSDLIALRQAGDDEAEEILSKYYGESMDNRFDMDRFAGLKENYVLSQNKKDGLYGADRRGGGRDEPIEIIENPLIPSFSLFDKEIQSDDNDSEIEEDADLNLLKEMIVPTKPIELVQEPIGNDEMYTDEEFSAEMSRKDAFDMTDEEFEELNIESELLEDIEVNDGEEDLSNFDIVVHKDGKKSDNQGDSVVVQSIEELNEALGVRAKSLDEMIKSVDLVPTKKSRRRKDNSSVISKNELFAPLTADEENFISSKMDEFLLDLTDDELSELLEDDNALTEKLILDGELPPIPSQEDWDSYLEKKTSLEFKQLNINEKDYLEDDDDDLIPSEVTNRMK